MITVKLSVEEYNRLYYMREDIYFLCKKLEDEIAFVDINNERIIASVKLHTKAGRILSCYTDCLLTCCVKENKSIIVHNVCIGDYADCMNCSTCGYTYSYSCDKGISKKLRKLKYKIDDIQFIDPLSNRDRAIVDKIKKRSCEIHSMKNDFLSNPDEEIKKICRTADVLENQLKELFGKWDYERGVK